MNDFFFARIFEVVADSLRFFIRARRVRRSFVDSSDGRLRVNPQVSLQRRLQREALRADVTSERLLAAVVVDVRPHVTAEAAACRKVLAAREADKRAVATRVVDDEVLAHGVDVEERLAADGALVRPSLAADGVVDPSVHGEVRLRGERPAARGTSVVGGLDAMQRRVLPDEVAAQRHPRSKPPAAVVARDRPLARVRARVLLEAAGAGERLVAEPARVRPLRRVRRIPVGGERGGAAESEPADLADQVRPTAVAELVVAQRLLR